MDAEFEVGQGPDDQEVSVFDTWPEIGLPPAMEAPNPCACHGIDIAPVGGVTIGVSEQLLQQPAIGDRPRGDRVERQRRSCQRCRKYGTLDAALFCNGKNGRTGGSKNCDFFKEDGSLLE